MTRRAVDPALAAVETQVALAAVQDETLARLAEPEPGPLWLTATVTFKLTPDKLAEYAREHGLADEAAAYRDMLGRLRMEVSGRLAVGWLRDFTAYSVEVKS
jgi:hypothetical protein